MHALIYPEEGQPLTYREYPDPQPEEGKVVIDLKAAALNHRDVFITQGLYPGVYTPLVMGSDGAGLYGEREVVINPAMAWGDDPRVQSKSFHILGLPHPGTFAQRVAVPTNKIYDKPAHLSWAEAAALPLAGLTAYRALFTQGRCTSGQRVLISGVGGGVALFAFQFALAAGAEVFVTSGTPEKLDRAREMGASGGVNYREVDWSKKLKEMAKGFDVIIDSAAGSGFAQLVKLVNPGGRIVLYGGTRGKIDGLSPQILFWKQATITGSTMGTDAEFAEMITFVTTHQIKPVVDCVMPLPEGQQGFERMAAGQQFGKIVFEIPG